MLEKKKKQLIVLGGMRGKGGGFPPANNIAFIKREENMNSLVSDVPGLSLIKARNGIEK